MSGRSTGDEPPASRYSDTVSLTDLLDPVVVTAIAKKGTGQKYLVAPNAG